MSNAQAHRGPRFVRVRKGTTFSGTLDGIDRLERFQCPGIGVDGHHHSGCSEGTDSSGHFFTRRLQTYPPRMCEELARMIVDTAQRMLRTGEGPTGVGVWSFGAQLRRDVYSVPFVLYNFIDRFQGQVVRLWPSVRCELIQMAWAVRFMELKVDLPFSDKLLATDAMGGNDLDHGGFGVCITPISSQELDCLRVSAEQMGFALNLSEGGLSNPERVIVPTIPFTVLPDALFCEDRWKVVMHGRWKFSDPIAIGEARAVCKALRWLTTEGASHEKIWYSLQDNMVCKSVFTRGRSSCWG